MRALTNTHPHKLFHVDLSITQHTSASQQTQLAHTHTSYKLTLESGTHNTNNIMCYDLFPPFTFLCSLYNKQLNELENMINFHAIYGLGWDAEF